jgi:hypothetical protein
MLNGVVILSLLGRDRMVLAVGITARADDADERNLRDLILKWPRNLTETLDRAQLKLRECFGRDPELGRPVGARKRGSGRVLVRPACSLDSALTDYFVKPRLLTPSDVNVATPAMPVSS